MSTYSFDEAVGKLEKLGINHECIYLIDLVLLTEMAWADGKLQKGELQILFDYLKSHVNTINRMAGIKVVSFENAKSFVRQFLLKRPDAETLAALHEIIEMLKDIRIDSAEASDMRLNLLNACLDIASISVTHYPYGLKERFTQEEKDCYHQITKLLSGNPIE